MNRVFVFLVLICIFLSIESFGQNRIDPIKNRYPGGEAGFMEYLMKTIVYPESSTDNKSVGYSISRISLSASGAITDIKITNPIDQDIDKEVIRVIKLSEKKWKEIKDSDSSKVLYIQIAFTFYGITPHYCNSKTSVYERLFIKPIVITCMPIPQDENEILDDSELTENCNRLLDESKYLKASYILNELIKRDPFNKELYRKRILANTALGLDVLVIKDNNTLNNFAEEYSLDEVKGGN